MTQQQAKEILLLYRPGTADAEDPALVQAMAVARQNPELGRWFEQHRAFQTAMRNKFRQLEAPEHLRLALLAAQRKPVVPPLSWWRPPLWLAAAAAVVLLAIALFWPGTVPPNRFDHYRQTMVSHATSGYYMDWTTRDMQQLRSAIANARADAPADYALSPGLQQLNLLGGAVLHWRGHPVTMLCFAQGTTRTWLFVMKTSALPDPPKAAPTPAKVSQLLTAGWTSGNETYLLATEESNLAKYLPAL